MIMLRECLQLLSKNIYNFIQKIIYLCKKKKASLGKAAAFFLNFIYLHSKTILNAQQK